jgi:hypothetical protein
MYYLILLFYKNRTTIENCQFNNSRLPFISDSQIKKSLILGYNSKFVIKNLGLFNCDFNYGSIVSIYYSLVMGETIQFINCTGLDVILNTTSSAMSVKYCVA